MATENRTDSRKNFVPCFLPWILAAAAFVVYASTLNRWVSLFNVAYVAKISGWTWQTEVTNPVSFLLTYPFRWLPVAEIPIALNLFTAACAALTLGLLARSVAILPQDRTDVQRKRERSDFSFLTIGNAWLPPVLAVAVCGLQLSFWEHATNCTGEMFNLLLYAFVIWLLLEYRMDEREWRLYLAAAVYGAGMAENWGMVGFFPLFFAGIIWLRGLRFFNVHFLAGMLLCGLAGMLFYLLMPLLAVSSGNMPVTFWQALKVNLVPQYDLVKYLILALFHLFQPQYLQNVALLLVYMAPALAPVLRWKASFGDHSHIGSTLATFMFHFVHAMLFGVCIWLMLDPPFSPREKGFGLAFYYFLALAAGYYAGYFMLVFQPELSGRSGRAKRPTQFQFLNIPAIAGVFLALILAVTILVFKNTPQIRATNGDTFLKYASLVDENLPRTGGILLCDDARRLFITQASLVRQGRSKDFLMLDTRSMNYPEYHKFLHAESPQKWPDTVTASEKTNGVSALRLIGLLTSLAKTNELYYLHPSFGYYFEEFYLEPHGLAYKMKTLPEDTLLPPPPDKNLIAENEAFWSQAETQAFAPIENANTTPGQNAPQTFADKMFDLLHIEAEPDQNSVVAGTFYSRGLDFWGVQLQRAGDLTNAAAHFEKSQKLNPDNVVARINLQFNQKLAAGQIVPVDLSGISPDQFGKYRTWNNVLNENGPFDEPSYCFAQGQIFADQSRLFRQSIELFNRVRKLDPDFLPARLQLAASYLISRLPDRALDALREPMEQPKRFSLSETNSTQINLLAAAAYFQKDETASGTRLIETEISRHPDSDGLLVTAAQAYLAHGLFTNAMTVVNHKLKSAPSDPTWLFTKGYIYIQEKNYDAAIPVLTRVLSIQTTNSQALFDRAIAELDSDRLDAARADYETLHTTYTNSFQVAYGLGEIAWRQHDTNEAIKNYEAYLAAVPRTNTMEVTNILQRLRELKK